MNAAVMTIGVSVGAVLGVWGILQVVLGSMTRIEPHAWRGLQSGFFVAVLAGSVLAGWLATRQSGHAKDGAWAGLLAGVIGHGAFVVALLGLSYFFAEAMVQYPFEQEDYSRRGAGSVRQFLDSEGTWREVVGLSLTLWAAFAAIQAGLGALGGVTSRMWAK